MLEVSILPDSIERHTSHPIAGLYDLAAKNVIKVNSKTKLRKPYRQHTGGTLWLEVFDTDTQQTKTACIDMVDWPDVASLDGLEKCDIYFKRSFSAEHLDRVIDPRLRGKIKPYGLYFACKSLSQFGEYTYRRQYLHLNGQLLPTSPARIKNIIEHYKGPFKSTLFRLGLSKTYSYLINPEHYESPPKQNFDGKIIFFTRIWDPAEIPEDYREGVIALNNSRLQLVDELRRLLGDKFLGGIMEDAYSLQHHPEYVIEHRLCTRANYLKIMQNADICIASTGLHGSIGAKLPEYLAASKCIISEPLVYNLPKDLVAGRDIAYYRSPSECVKLCSELLANPEKVAQMQYHAQQYYLQNAKPAAQMQARLKEIFSPS